MELENKLLRFEQDLTTAFYDIQEYRKIFTGTDARNKILNKSAPNFFLIYQRYFWNNIILSITRLLDPPKMGQYTNLTIEILFDTAIKNNLSCSDELRVLINSLRDKKELLKIWRDKIIAHRDEAYALKSDYKEISINLVEVEEILQEIGKCVNLVYGEHRQSTMSWRVITNASSEALLYYLREGLVYSELKKKRNNRILDNKEYEESSYPE